jgi:hypothetical protein
MQKAIECLRQRTLPTTNLSPGKERGFTLKVPNPFKRRTKENFG